MTNTIELRTPRELIYINRPSEENEFMYQMGFINASCLGAMFFMKDLIGLKQFCKDALKKDTVMLFEEDEFSLCVIYLDKEVLVICKRGDTKTPDEQEVFAEKFNKGMFYSFLNKILTFE